MSEVLENNTLEYWQRDPVRFIEEVMRNPKTGKPFELFEAQRRFFEHAWQIRDDGRLLYPEQCLGMVKKTGKTASAAMHVLTTTLVFGGRYAEAYCVANDLEQAQGRVFQAIRQICESSPLLKREAEITQSRITFPQTGAVIHAIGSDYASAAGAHPCISSHDELWGATSERARRLFEECIPVPTAKISCRLTTTHAGYSGESALLEEDRCDRRPRHGLPRLHSRPKRTNISAVGIMGRPKRRRSVTSRSQDPATKRSRTGETPRGRRRRAVAAR